jgi:hypothetical protein
MRRNHARNAIIAELNRRGVRWFERAGSKHPHIVLDIPGQPFVTISSTNRFDGPIDRIARSQVRRVLRDHESLKAPTAG